MAPLPREVNNSPAIPKPAGHQGATSVSFAFLRHALYSREPRSHFAEAVVHSALYYGEREMRYSFASSLGICNCTEIIQEKNGIMQRILNCFKDEDRNTNSPRSLRYGLEIIVRIFRLGPIQSYFKGTFCRSRSVTFAIRAGDVIHEAQEVMFHIVGAFAAFH